MSQATQSSEEEVPPPWWLQNGNALGSYLISFFLHLILLLCMGLAILPTKPPEQGPELLVDTTIEERPEVESLQDFSIVPQDIQRPEPPGDPVLPAEKIVDEPGVVELDLDVEELMQAAAASEILQRASKKGEFGGRTDQGRAAMSQAFGGSAGSEAAVSDGLEWLKNHQREDGSWSFDHRCPHCDETCSHSGSLGNSTIAATSMAMLCFVGAGHTHRKGAYQPQVQKGLKFLMSEASKAPRSGDLRQVEGGNTGMYTQGLVTILLCELHGLTQDKEVRRVATSCMKFIVEAQNTKTGGWRYQPGDEGDTSVVGWQVMAQTSARMSRVAVSTRSRQLASRYLDSVQLENGAYYGYTAPQKRPSTTAVGLLCRMYEGWGHDHPGLKAGVQFLSDQGPDRENMYYNYYATQVMRHWGGDEWTRWNLVMREMLVRSQDQTGHAKGSWVPRDPHGREGGRHYMTCLAILTLEVYYRHLPIYQQQSVEQGKGDGPAE